MTPESARDVPFAEVATPQLSRYEGSASVIAGGSDAARARIAQLVPGASASGRVPVAVFQGSQRTGGYAIHVDRIERDGDRLIVHATFTDPPPGGVVTQVLTSPADVVSISASDGQGLRTVTLLDAAGRARATADVR